MNVLKREKKSIKEVKHNHSEEVIRGSEHSIMSVLQWCGRQAGQQKCGNIEEARDHFMLELLLSKIFALKNPFKQDFY